MPYIHRWDVDRPRLLVHVVHGMAEHGARYERLARELNTHGVAVWAHDHRGHGKTATSSGGLLGHFADANGWRLVVDDAWGVSREMAAAHTGVPLVLFAHSMGSFVGQTLLGEHGVAYRAVVLSGTDGPPDVAEGFLRTLSVAQLRILGGRSPGQWTDGQIRRNFNRRFEPRKTDFDWLSRDAAEVRKYVDDPLCGFALSSQTWFDFLHGKSDLGSEAQVEKIPRTLPIHLIAGTHDPVGKDGKGVRKLFDIYAKQRLKVSKQLYDQARHELVNETNRKDVTADLIAWLRQFAVS